VDAPEAHLDPGRLNTEHPFAEGEAGLRGRSTKDLVVSTVKHLWHLRAGDRR
jgi:hypothetical protein